MGRVLQQVLLDAYKAAKHGSGRVVLLTGDSGLGKTHAVELFLRAMSQEAPLILRAKARPQSATPFYPIYEGLGDYLVSHAGEGRTAKLISKYHFSLPGLRSLCAPLLNDDSFIRRESDAFRIQDPAQYFHFVNLLKEIAGTRTLIFFLDDFQWADRETLELVAYLADHIAGKNLLFMLAANLRHKITQDREALEDLVEYLHKDEQGCCIFYDLLPAPPDQLKELIEEILDYRVQLTSEVLHILAVKTRGVPLIVKTFIKFLVDSGALKRRKRHYVLVRPMVEIPLPQSLKDDLQRRLKRVYRVLPEARALLELASVIGERFADADLDTILNLCDAFRLLGLIEDNHLLVRNLLSHRLWEFEHVIVRDFIYETLGAAANKLHIQIAQHLVSSGSCDYQRIAYHYGLGGAQVEAMEANLRYGQLLLRQGNFREARHIFDSLWSRPLFTSTPAYLAAPADAELNRALCSFYMAEYGACLSVIARARVLFPQANVDSRFILLRCRCLNKSSSAADFDDARMSLESLLERAANEHDSLFVARIWGELVVSYAHLNRFDRARDAFESARKMMIVDPIEHARLMRKAIVLFEPELAMPILETALSVVKESGIVHEEIMIKNNIGACQIMIGNYRNAADLLAQAISEAAELGNFRLDYLLSNRGAARLGLGLPDGALNDLQEAARFARRPVNLLCISNNHAAALISLGHLDEALTLLARITAEASLVKEDVYIAYTSFNLALALVLGGKPGEALFVLMALDLRRLACVGSFYGARRMKLIYLCFQRLNSIREGAIELEPTTIAPDVITMEFWGD